MSHLIRAELNRWFSRRLWWGLTAGALAVVALVVVGLALSLRPPSAAEAAELEREYGQMQAEHQQAQQECLDEGGTAEECDYGMPTREEWGVARPSYADSVEVSASTAAVLGGLGALVLGASFIGADLRGGSLATWLTYVPRRASVFVSKATAVAVGGAVFGVLVQGLMQAGTAGAAMLWDGPAAVTAAPDGWAVAGRGLALTVFAALIGFGLATLMGNTVAPLVTMLGLLVLQWVSGLFGLLFGSLPRVLALLPDANVAAFLYHGHTIYYAERVGAELVEKDFVLDLTAASIYLAVVLVVTVTVAGWSFSRREVR